MVKIVGLAAITSDDAASTNRKTTRRATGMSKLLMESLSMIAKVNQSERLPKMCGDTQCVCRDGQAGVDTAARWEKRRIDNEQIRETMDSIRRIEHTCLGIIPKAAGATDMGGMSIVIRIAITPERIRLQHVPQPFAEYL